MNPAKVNRDNVKSLLDLPNVGPATKADLYLLGIHKSEQLVGLDAYEMHERLCQLTKIKHDPCVIDIFLSLVCFANGGPAKLATLSGPLFEIQPETLGPMFYGYMTMTLFVGYRSLVEVILFSYAMMGWWLAVWIMNKFR